jgi:hypothetical protein
VRTLVTWIICVGLALSIFGAFGSRAEALVTGYDSAYAGESAFLALQQGQTGSFSVFFQNTGLTTWTRGSSTQVDLFACRDNKVTCDVTPEEIAFNPGSWFSGTRYSTQVQTTVAPGSIATFAYTVRVPTNAAPGTYRFNGDLGVSAIGGSGGRIHPEGYFQDVTVVGGTGQISVTFGTMSPTNATNPRSSASDTSDNGSAGEETYTFTLRDGGGNAVSPAVNTPVQFSVSNTGGGVVFIVNCDGGSTSVVVPAGATSTACQATIRSGGDTSATIEVDSGTAGSATITANAPGIAPASGGKTWTATAVTHATISPTSATNTRSGAGDTSNNGSVGEETYTLTLRDAGGNATSPSSNTTVQFFVRNTGSGTVFVVNCDGGNTSVAVSPGTTTVACTTVITSGGDTSATVELDANTPGSATITGSPAGLGPVSATKTWTQTPVTRGSLSPTSATNRPSDAGDTSNNGSRGEELYTFTLRDSAGNAVSPPSNTTVQFFVTNTGGGTMRIVACDGSNTSVAVSPGTTSSACAATIRSGGDTSATIEVDASTTTSATITASVAGLGSVSATKTWRP